MIELLIVLHADNSLYFTTGDVDAVRREYWEAHGFKTLVLQIDPDVLNRAEPVVVK